MNPQFGYRQSNNAMYCSGVGQSNNAGNSNQRQQCYPQGYSSSTAKLNVGNSTCGNWNPRRARAPPVFCSPSAGNVYGGTSNRPQQSSWGGSSVRPRQGVGRSSQYQSAVRKFQSPASTCSPRYQQQQQPRQQQTAAYRQQKPMSSPPSCAPPQPQTIKVNVTAAQLQNAQSAPIYDRGEPNQSENANMKYIQLNWQDLLGGMENMQVSMVPSADPSNPNRQLKVSFGGQTIGPAQNGETKLKVISMEPVGTGGMSHQQANTFAGTMNVGNSPGSPSSSYRQQGRPTYRR